MITTGTVDVWVEEVGSLTLFRPITEAARRWLLDNTETEEWHWFRGRLVVDWRYAGPLAEEMRKAGLRLS